MIGDFDSILSDEEAQRLESAFLALGATSANGERPVSEAEERAWFAHLQQGDARGQRALALAPDGKGECCPTDGGAAGAGAGNAGRGRALRF